MDRAGDIDGDGTDDWVIADQTLGGAWVVSGRDGSVLREFDLGIRTGGIGRYVAGLGDVDGDGVPDVGIAASPPDEPPVAAVFSGRDGSLIRHFAASSLVGLGDVDGDGCADVLVIESEELEGDRTMDRASLCSGRTGEVLWTVEHSCGNWTGHPFGRTLSDLAGPPYARTFSGLEGSSGADVLFIAGDQVLVLRRSDGSIARSIGCWKDMAPASAAFAGDLDGDGCEDLIVGYVDDSGAAESRSCVRILSGRTGSLVWSRSGGAGYPGDFGADVDGAGDVDGDGTPDVLVVTYTTFLIPNGILVLSGRSGRVLREILPDLPECHRRFCARSIPDVDGDGVNDILAGITPGDYPCADGLVEVFSGRTRQVLWRFRRNGPRLESIQTPGDERWTR